MKSVATVRERVRAVELTYHRNFSAIRQNANHLGQDARVARSSCVGIGNDRPDSFNILFIATFADDFGTGLGRQNERASLGPTVTENDAFSDQGRITSLHILS